MSRVENIIEMNDLEQQETAPEEDSQAEAKTEVDSGLASVRQVFSFGSGPKKRLGIILGLLCAFIAGCVYPGMAFYFAKSFEELAAPTSSSSFMDEIRKLAYAFMVMGAVVLASMSAYAMLLETAATEMTISLKTEWFNALLRQDLAYFDIKDVSGTSSLISTNGAKYKNGVGRKLGMGVQFLVTFVGCMGYAFYASWKASLVVLTIIPFMALSAWFVLKTNQSQSARNNASYAEAGSIVYTAVSSIRTILSLNAVQSMIDKFKGATEKARRLACSQLHLIGLANGSMMGSFFLSFIVVTLFGSYILYDQVRKNGCDPSGATGNDKCDPAAMDVFGCLMGITFAAGVLPQLSNSIESFAGARAACYLAISTMNRKVGAEEKDPDLSQSRKAARRGSTVPLPKYVIDSSSPDGLKPDNLNGRIEFRNVTFSYPTRKEINVFDGFSLDVPAGSTVALVGPSGSGKSTSVQLLERFYDPKAGSITLDGHDLRELNVKWLRQHIGLVSQEPKLFACSIKENIAYGYPGATVEQIEEAARMANAHDFIKTFPEGYDTQVGDLGGKLSGGQKQRIAIARVLVKNPKIILLDEATSALDSESEGVVQQALDRLMEDGSRTIIVIAHRLSTIRNADLIAVVHEGKVVETGKHDELISAKGRYYELVEAQKAPPVPAGNGNSKSEHSSAPSSRVSSEVDLQALDSADAVPLLHFNNVHFTYPSRPDNEVFRGLNLSVYPGETLALVGPSGHGKSTTVQLIERFYDPDDGTIELDGVDLKSLNVQWLREQVGLVSQEPMLFDTTIAENIRFGHERATQDEIEEAAREANAHDFIMSFPDGYDTQVGGSGGTQVSGGQKQRLAIARALLRKPRILLLDEATSSLDSESERIVQEALEKVMAATERTTIVIAHRLSTIRNADRIAVIVDGKVREIGTHEELMAKLNGRYRRLQAFQNLEREKDRDRQQEETSDVKKVLLREDIDEGEDTKTIESLDDGTREVDKERAKIDAQRSRVLAKDDRLWFFVGAIGAVLGGAIFPGMGFIFAYMIDVLYSPVFECTDPAPFDSCEEYWNFQADRMKDLAGKIAWGSFGLIIASLVGFTLLYYGFGKASENMNKRVRDVAFVALVRQEVAYFDMRPVGTITSRIQEDAALIHSFSGQPIRTLVLNLASVLVGLVISFVYMWPFALLTLAILPFLAFGAEMEMRMYMGEDEGDDSVEDENSPGGIVVETLVNIRTVASLTIEETRSSEYVDALRAEDPTPYRSNFIKGIGLGLGQFFQFYGIGLMMWWGGWLLYNYPDLYAYRDFLISMFSLLFSLYGVAVAAEGATDRERAKLAARRIFDLTDRDSAIDPLSAEGKKGV